jgi:hypothetical protein
MKRRLFSVLFVAMAGIAFTGCNNGVYDVDPKTDNTNIFNPLNPPGGLNTSFGWGGTDPMSAEVNGVAWKADAIYLVDLPTDNDHWVVAGTNNSGDTSSCALVFRKDVEAGKVYYLHIGNTEQYASYTSKQSDPNTVYASTLTQQGQIKILENDNTHIKGLFFFMGKSPATGLWINIGKGYFNVNKP